MTKHFSGNQLELFDSLNREVVGPADPDAEEKSQQKRHQLKDGKTVPTTEATIKEDACACHRCGKHRTGAGDEVEELVSALYGPGNT